MVITLCADVIRFCVTLYNICSRAPTRQNQLGCIERVRIVVLESRTRRSVAIGLDCQGGIPLPLLPLGNAETDDKK